MSLGNVPLEGTVSPVVRMEGVAKSYALTPVLHDLSLEVAWREIVAILGPSGCGKTTTLRLIAGFESPDAGEIFVQGRLVASSTLSLPPERRQVGMVFQDYALFPHLTVAQNVAFGLAGMPEEQRKKVVAVMLELVHMEGFAQRYPHQLSGGQQQRVALARALAPCPAALLLDEPFSNLDADMRPRMRQEVLAILREAKTTAVLVTHDQEEAFSLADRVAVLHQGRLEQVDTAENLYHQPRTPFVARFVGQADFVPGEVRDGQVVTELGTFPLDGQVGAARVRLMVRPDDIELEPGDGGSAAIVGREFRGSENMYILRMDSGTTLRSSQPSLTVYSVGQRVKARATLCHVVVFPEEVET
ncbi:MAG: ABC transporter ATP-binding protein [Chloroflexi bacterium]|nr:ABC transporter ATP-binding protein [Chloroflexota bacterium]